MRDFPKENTAQDLALKRAADKVERQADLVASMNLDDPRLGDETKLLIQMRQSLSALQTNRAMLDYDNEGDDTRH